MKSRFILGLLIPFCFGASAVSAGPVKVCQTNSVSITEIDGASVDKIDATACAGVYPGANDDAGNLSGLPNLGGLGSGLLNGGNWSSNPAVAFNPEAFVSESEWRAANAPGWIHLANIEFDGTSAIQDNISYSSVGDGASSFGLAGLLEITWVCTNKNNGCKQGIWSLQYDDDIFDELTALLGKNSFDHLAITIQHESKLAVYDFDFRDIGLSGLGAGHSFAGNWKTSDFAPDTGFSNVNFWLRDPLVDESEQTVPAPATLLLFGLGLVGLGWSRRKSN